MLEENNLTKRERRELKKQEKDEMRDKNKKKELKNRLIIWAFAFLVISLVIFVFIKYSGSSQSGELLNSTINDSDQVAGNRDAKITLIEYSDFQCPACKNYASIVKRITEEYSGEIAFVYRHFPLNNHKNAEPAAYAAEAAGKQDKFWEMHYKLFENQELWEDERNPEEKFISYAESFNLDIQKFKNDMDSEEVKEKVDNDLTSGLRSGINSTPTFYLNGNIINNPSSYEGFKSIIEQSLRESDS